MTVSGHKYNNQLIHETSPYLQQHSHNPVNWLPWGEAAFKKAKKEKKPVIVSIGYSACHWCHVMNRESFSDESVAETMNKHYICIKVDREERPDIDQLYMDALNLMQIQGGWPLNCFLLPDGKPFWGGTYFTTEEWKELLTSINDIFQNQYQRVESHAKSITDKIKALSQQKTSVRKASLNFELLDRIYINFRKRLDFRDGGFAYAPKFPMPVNILFLLRYAHAGGAYEAMGQALLTLEKMAMGGIYDHAGGGFARYSTDVLWKVPHFEKMLYDNALLVSLYSEAYNLTGNSLFKRTTEETLDFIKREMTGDKGQFFSSVDADSDGEEGKFYVWSRKEIDEVLEKDSGIFCRVYGVENEGYWREDDNILLTPSTIKSFADKHFLDLEDFEKLLNRCRKKIFKARLKRVKPLTDNKSITAWNSLMLKAFSDAYQITGNESYIETAIKNEVFINNNMAMPDGGLYHIFSGKKSYIKGMLDDYAFTIEAYISLYQATFNEKYINRALELMQYTISKFKAPEGDLLLSTSEDDPLLITRKAETHDLVIQSGNSSIARSLLLLSRITLNPVWREKSKMMLNHVIYDAINSGYSYGNWCILLSEICSEFYIIGITGKGALEEARKFRNYYFPAKFIVASEEKSGTSCIKDNPYGNKATITICSDSQCLMQPENVSKAIEELEKLKESFT